MRQSQQAVDDVSNDRMTAMRDWRRELAQMGRVIRIVLVVAVLMLAGVAFVQQQGLVLIVAGVLLGLDGFCRYAFGRLDEAAEILHDDDLPLNAFDQESQVPQLITQVIDLPMRR